MSSGAPAAGPGASSANTTIPANRARLDAHLRRPMTAPFILATAAEFCPARRETRSRKSERNTLVIPAFGGDLSGCSGPGQCCCGQMRAIASRWGALSLAVARDFYWAGQLL